LVEQVTNSGTVQTGGRLIEFSCRMEKVVCVTGGSGAIGSWLVHLLLDRGYTVHATVQNLS